jgi:hypothetical protein
MFQALRRIAPSALVLGLLVSAGLAQAPRSAGLEPALNSIQVENIKADIFFLASDELGGRDTPSVGQRIAARYIKARMERLGLSPGAGEDYFYEYKLLCRQLNTDATKADVVKAGEKLELNFGSDYAFHSSGITTATVSGKLMFCGDASDEDIAKLDLAGKWALCEDNSKRSNDRRSAAKKAGAIGLIIAPGPKTSDEKMAARVRDYAAGVKRPNVQFPDSKVRERDDFPSVMITGSATDRILALAGSFNRANARPANGTDLGVVYSDQREELGKDGTVEVENVCALWPGSDPKLSKEVIIISAHYDHVGTSSDGTVFNGADDNASGTTGLLQIAEALSVHGPMKRTILLIWVSGEEKGLMGSKAWCLNPQLPPDHRPVCNLNIDMIGRNAPESLLITPTKARKADYNGLTRLAEANCGLEGFTDLGSADDYWFRSDHANFASYLKIPVAFLFDDVHVDYHTSTDDPEKIDCDKIRRVSRLVFRMLDGLQSEVLDL